MTETRKLRVFLCHSSQDKPIVRDLYQRLNAEGWIDPWLDEEKLLPGQDWDMEIEKAVEAADIVIVCLSNNSVTKEGYIQRELRIVLGIADFKPEDTLFVIPVRLDNCPVPRRLLMWQYVDYFLGDRKEWAYQRLLQSLNNRRSKIQNQETLTSTLLNNKIEGADLSDRGVKQELNELEKRKAASLMRFVDQGKKDIRINPPAKKDDFFDKFIHYFYSGRLSPVKDENFFTLFSRTSSIVGSFLGIMFYFLPWDGINLSGFQMSFYRSSFYGYSPAFLLIPVIFSMIMLVALYYAYIGRTPQNIGYFIFDCGAVLSVVLLAHVPWEISENLIGRVGAGLWGTILSIIFILLSGLIQLLQTSSRDFQEKLLYLKRRLIVYFVILVFSGFIVYFADDIF